MQKHFPPTFHIIHQSDLDNNYFLINQDEEKGVPCVFQIWQKKDFNRLEVVKQEANGFTFVKRDENPDISFRRVGVYAGKIDTDNLVEKNTESHYFIKFNEDIDCHHKDLIIQQMKTVVFPCDNTVGPKSISKQEIIAEYNKLFD